MANACIAYTNRADVSGVLITATSANLLLPASNVVNPHIARKWRGTTTGSDSIIIDMGAPITFDTMAVFGLVADQVIAKASLVDATGAAGEIYSDTVAVDQAYLDTIHLTTPRSARYFRFELTKSASFVEAGRVFIGSRTQFAYNFVKGWSRVWIDTSLRSRTRGGQTQVWPDNVYRSYDVSFDFLTKADRDGFVEDIDRVNAMKTDILFITDPASTNLARDSVWGLVTSISPVVQQFINSYTKQYQIDERL